MAANLSLRIGEEAPVFMAAVLESLVVRLVSIAGLTAHNDMRSKINHHHLQIFIRNDEELSVLLTGEDTSCTSNVVFSCFFVNLKRLIFCSNRVSCWSKGERRLKTRGLSKRITSEAVTSIL